MKVSGFATMTSQLLLGASAKRRIRVSS